MDEFFSKIQRLRDAVKEKQIYDTSSTDDWNTLTSTMGALEDTHHAISAFVVAVSKLEPKQQKRELGERYLRIYGVMQALVIQQDATRNLHVSLGMPEPDLKRLAKIKDLRVAAAGHPTLQDPQKKLKLPRRAHFISQRTLDDGGMQLITVDGSGQPSVLVPPEFVDQCSPLHAFDSGHWTSQALCIRRLSVYSRRTVGHCSGPPAHCHFATSPAL